jgi:pyridinium-3,5-biscarboxylic acid mononucleotide sulfurtransferase
VKNGLTAASIFLCRYARPVREMKFRELRCPAHRRRAANCARTADCPRGIISHMAAGTSSQLSNPTFAANDVAEAKLRVLEARLATLDGLMVAYSGGVDSAFLAATAHRVLGDRMLAVLADSPSLARQDLDDARAFAEAQGIPLRIVFTDELEKPEYQRNQSDRCFHCKTELFDSMQALRGELGFPHLAFGMNADDQKDFRPGQRAAQDHGVLAPLAEAGLTKSEIRALAKAAGYTLWDRPAAPCLSSRVEYGRTVTREVLNQVEQAEESLRRLGFRELRVRHHGELARVEIARTELPRALTMEMLNSITTALKQAGFQYVTLDTAGFRSGAMNEILPVEVLTSRTSIQTR